MNNRKFQIGDAVTRDINDPTSKKYRVIDWEEELIICLELCPWIAEPIKIHHNQLKKILP